MHWFFIALAAPFLWAIVNIADNYLVARFSRKEEGIRGDKGIRGSGTLFWSPR